MKVIYRSKEGKDKNSGLSAIEPVKTLSKALSIAEEIETVSITAGDSLTFDSIEELNGAANYYLTDSQKLAKDSENP